MKLEVKIQPSSGRQEVIKQAENNKYKVFLKSPPENNKANTELIKLLKKTWPKKEVKIFKGFTSKNKIIEIK